MMVRIYLICFVAILQVFSGSTSAQGIGGVKQITKKDLESHIAIASAKSRFLLYESKTLGELLEFTREQERQHAVERETFEQQQASLIAEFNSVVKGTSDTERGEIVERYTAMLGKLKSDYCQTIETQILVPSQVELADRRVMASALANVSSQPRVSKPWLASILAGMSETESRDFLEEQKAEMDRLNQEIEKLRQKSAERLLEKMTQEQKKRLLSKIPEETVSWLLATPKGARQ